ncbi:MAG: HD domain-containing protein [Clostridium sp.]|nr:HD domain-containing protein [Clostridium sp.]MCM1172714.1 HD domain-containing protein [Clostridium sp.]MCM1207974.1 HD domain-containing protein [Ruminococcus sp.]
MYIEEKRILDAFKRYTDAYDGSNGKIKLKVNHTYRVAGLCREIAVSIGLDLEDAALAWLIGMLHDIGRFEQIKRYDTFSDVASVDHAMLGADILFQEGKIRDYIDDDREDTLIETAIRQHSLYRIDENLSERTQLFCNILRDADKIDILKVFSDTSMEAVYGVTHEEVYTSEVSPAVMASFFEHHATLRSLKKTTVDFLVANISLVYELVFSGSKKILRERGYLDKLLDFKSENDKTNAQFDSIREELKLCGIVS